MPCGGLNDDATNTISYNTGITLLNGNTDREGDGSVKGSVGPRRELCRVGTEGFDEGANF